MPTKMSWVNFGQHFPPPKKPPESNACKNIWGKTLDRISHLFTKCNLHSRMPTKMSWVSFGQHFPLKLKDLQSRSPLKVFGAKIWTAFPLRKKQVRVSTKLSWKTFRQHFPLNLTEQPPPPKIWTSSPFCLQTIIRLECMWVRPRQQDSPQNPHAAHQETFFLLWLSEKKTKKKKILYERLAGKNLSRRESFMSSFRGKPKKKIIFYGQFSGKT